jgi:hypothetical protein
VGTFEGLLEEVTQYKESERLLADPLAASGDMAIAEGLTFTNKAASSLHWASVKVGSSTADAACQGTLCQTCSSLGYLVSAVEAIARCQSCTG